MSDITISSKTFKRLWLSAYGAGSVLTVATAGVAAGGSAAGTLAGFLVLGGIIGHEIISRQNFERKTEKNIQTLLKNQDRLSYEIAKEQKPPSETKAQPEQKSWVFKPASEQSNITKQNLPPPPEKISFSDLVAQRPAGKAYQPPLERNARKSTFLPLGKAVSTSAKLPDNLLSAFDMNDRPFTDTVVIELLHNAIQNHKIEAFTQPIVTLPARRIAYLEVFARIRVKAGQYLTAERYKKLAEAENLMPVIDQHLLTYVLNSIHVDARNKISTSYFLNITAATLKDNGFITPYLQFIKQNPEWADRIILELQQAEFMQLSPRMLMVLESLSRLGCRFSLDHIEDADIELAKLKRAGISFVKLDGARLEAMTKTPEGLRMLERFSRKLTASNISLIAEKVENESTLRELLDFEIDYGEGYLFGKPDLEMAYKPRIKA